MLSGPGPPRRKMRRPYAARTSPRPGCGLSQQPNTMLALMTGHRGEFAKDRVSVLSGKPLLAIPHCCRQLLVSPFSRQATAS